MPPVRRSLAVKTDAASEAIPAPMAYPKRDASLRRSGDDNSEHDECRRHDGEYDDVERPAAHDQEADPPGGQHRAGDGGEADRSPEQRAAEAESVDGDDEQGGDPATEDEQQRPLPQDDPERAPTRRSRGDGFPLGGHAGASHRSAASTTFCRSIARVIGPTPPGMGASQPATSRTAGSTSPTMPVSVRVMPTSRTAAPGRTLSGVTRPGTPAAATMMSARRRWPCTSWVPVWHRVTVAFSARRVSSRPSGRPTVTPRPTTTTSAPASATSYRRSSSTMPRGVHGSGPC